MSHSNHIQPKLPRELLDQLQPSGSIVAGSRGRKGPGPQGRKEQRKASREQKKVQRKQPKSHTFRPSQDHPKAASICKREGARASQPLEKKKVLLEKSKTDPPLKSILKKHMNQFPAPKINRSPSPEKTRKVSRVVKSKLAEDDAEIAALEKKLGVKGGGKALSSFEDDGLNDILGDVDKSIYESPSKRKRDEYDEWLERKRRKGGKDPEEKFADEVEGVFDSEDSDAELGTDSDGDPEDKGYSQDSDSEEPGDYFDGSESEDSELQNEPRVRENPYVAPVSASTSASAKYVPPSMRGMDSSDTEASTRLRRQIRGLLNRLSEANLLTILKDLESIYDKNPRQHVTLILIDILVDLISDRTNLTDTFIILHAGFVAAVYKVVGPHFGAQLLERLVSEFDVHYDLEKASNDGRKEASNIIALLAEMYTFQVVGSTIIFDYIRWFLTALSDLNTELLLKTIKNSGAQLRHDDPTSLKDIVILLQKAVAEVGEETLPVRTKYMIETINNLKNNRQKTGVAASAIALEHTTRMKKTLGTLNTRAGNASEPLGVSLTDIRSSKKEGKWWLVGASWRNDNVIVPTQTRDLDDKPSHRTDISALSKFKEEVESTDLLQLAKQQRMNTDIRRAIFVNIMSASDYKDAHTRLQKLKLKKAQELEIPRVLIHCAGAEGSYNPYYTLIARRLCSEHRFKWAFQYGLWDIFRRMGEKSELKEDGTRHDEEEDDTDMSLRTVVNLGRMYGHLIADGGQAITVFKTLNFAYLQAKTKSFLEVVLLTALRMIQQRKEGDSTAAIVGLFSKAKDSPQVLAGLQYFLGKEVNAADFTSNASERKVLKQAVRTATDALALLSSSTLLAE